MVSDCRNRIRSFVDSIDTSSETWKNELEEWIFNELTEKQDASRRARFSIGEASFDEIASSLPPTQEIGIQVGQNETTHIDPGDRCLDKITESWKNGEKVTTGEAVRLLRRGIIKARQLEGRFEAEDAIAVRRMFINKPIQNLPFTNYDYKYVVNSCCENVIGYVPVPVGIVGPLALNGETDLYVPMATTEGALVASTNRGASVIKAAGGVKSIVYENGMTRAPVIKMPSAVRAVEIKRWIEKAETMELLKQKFQSTSRFGKLLRIEVVVDGNLVFLRFVAFTGDAMGMNMVSKGCNACIQLISEHFYDMEMLSLSGNYCVDKKAAAVNWTQGRGRSVVAECTIPAETVKKVLKTTPRMMAASAMAKLQIGTARAACIGGSNAHAANVVAAVFLATGQDAAQVVSSSMCSTRMEETAEGDLYVSCTLPCVEVGTVGGGTILPPQNSMLQMLKCAGPATVPGNNADKLAEVVAATVLAGEVSLMAALVTDDLVASHMKLNRSNLDLYKAKPEKSQLDLDLEKAASMKANKHIKLKKINPELAHCSNIL